MTKPTELPEWASSPQDPSDIVTPSVARKLSGWHRNGDVPEKPPYQVFNWWQNKVYQWVAWFNSLLDQEVNTTSSPTFISINLSEGMNKPLVYVPVIGSNTTIPAGKQIFLGLNPSISITSNLDLIGTATGVGFGELLVEGGLTVVDGAELRVY